MSARSKIAPLPFAPCSACHAPSGPRMRLENYDLMPHNFVITLPGAMEEIGKLAEASATSPEFQARQFVPKSGKILLSSGLLQTRETQKLSFIAPREPGVYPYVCTYPGHWRRMYGALYVVEDLDGYLAAPEAYLSTHPLAIKDAFLKDNPPPTECTLPTLPPPLHTTYNPPS